MTPEHHLWADDYIASVIRKHRFISEGSTFFEEVGGKTGHYDHIPTSERGGKPQLLPKGVMMKIERALRLRYRRVRT